MISSKQKLSVSDINEEIELLEQAFRTTKRFLNAQVRFLQDIKNKQLFLTNPGIVADGATIGATENEIKRLRDTFVGRKRHLTALKRVLEDEAQNEDG